VPPRSTQQPRSLLGRVLLVLFALVAIALIMSVGIANVTARRMPQVALTFWPWHAAANARLAEFMITTDPQKQIKSAAPLAERALQRDPTMAPAARILALNALVDKDAAAAGKLFDYSASVSRRDLATQLWYIEKEVAEEDVEGALKHFDIALRTSPGSQRILFPILTSALQDPQLRPAIAKLLASKPAWAALFLQQSALSSPNPVSVANLYLTMNALGKPPTPDVIRVLPPGQYQLSGLAGDAAGGAYILSARLVCISTAAPESASAARLASGPIRMGGMLNVPGGNCPAQWLTLAVKGEGGDSAASPWIDDLTLTRR
jgi:hypothetical protein